MSRLRPIAIEAVVQLGFEEHLATITYKRLKEEIKEKKNEVKAVDLMKALDFLSERQTESETKTQKTRDKRMESDSNCDYTNKSNLAPKANTSKSELEKQLEESRKVDNKQHNLLKLNLSKRENARLKKRSACCKCKINSIDLTLLPCGNFSYCRECGSKFTFCPLYSKPILADVKTYLC